MAQSEVFLDKQKSKSFPDRPFWATQLPKSFQPRLFFLKKSLPLVFSRKNTYPEFFQEKSLYPLFFQEKSLLCTVSLAIRSLKKLRIHTRFQLEKNYTKKLYQEIARNNPDSPSIDSERGKLRYF